MSNHPKGRSWPNKTGIATKQDAIMTPNETSLRIINHFEKQIKGICLDPCKGEGSFYDNLPEPKRWAEINLGVDFFNWEEKVNWIITNPPYSIYDLFLTKCFEISENVVLLIPLQKLWKSKVNEKMVFEYGGIKEILFLGTGNKHGFPVGFPVGAVHFKKNYKGDIKYSRSL
tara:strand:- start:36 stop:551 length:516 start_codon:yes stop_codon:yes gene_type:complete